MRRTTAILIVTETILAGLATMILLGADRPAIVLFLAVGIVMWFLTAASSTP